MFDPRYAMARIRRLRAGSKCVNRINFRSNKDYHARKSQPTQPLSNSPAPFLGHAHFAYELPFQILLVAAKRSEAGATAIRLRSEVTTGQAGARLTPAILRFKSHNSTEISPRVDSN